MGSFRCCFHQHHVPQSTDPWSCRRNGLKTAAWEGGSHQVQGAVRKRKALSNLEAQPGKFSRGGRAFCKEEEESAPPHPRDSAAMKRPTVAGDTQQLRHLLGVRAALDTAALLLTGACFQVTWQLLLNCSTQNRLGFKCLKSRNQDGCFIYNFLQGRGAKWRLYKALEFTNGFLCISSPVLHHDLERWGLSLSLFYTVRVWHSHECCFTCGQLVHFAKRLVFFLIHWVPTT